MDVRLIRAFIASPSGLEDERRIAVAVAEQVNRAVAKEMGGRLELFGWEETISGSGRPQEIINAEMESCDLFIGAMWTSWGTPPAHGGLYSSGFEEEFELSRLRHGKTGTPTMSMYFKQIDPMQLRDPGDDLKRVLAFQEKLRSEKQFLYENFATPNDFADKIRAFLTVHTIRLLREVGSTRTEKPASVEQQPQRPEPQTVQAAESNIDAVEAKFLAKLAPQLRADPAPPADQIARLRLVAMVTGGSANDKLVLGAHDANLLYHARAGVEFSFLEMRGLLGAGLTELTHENVPIWSWLSAVIEDRPELLTALTLLGEDGERAGAIETMLLLGEPIRPLSFVDGDLVETRWLGAGTTNKIKLAALRYLEAEGSAAHLDAIDREAERADKDTLKLAQEAALSILLREDTKAAALRLIATSFETIDTTLLDQALDLLDELGTETLRLGLDHRAAEVRQRAIELLSARNALDLDTIGRAREDDAAVVRLAAIHALERLDQPLSLDEVRKILARPRTSPSLWFGAPGLDSVGLALFERYRDARLRQLPTAALKALLGTSEHRHAAYFALAARRIEEFPAQLRQDLKDAFKGYTALHWPDGIRSDMSPAASILSTGTSDPLEIKRRELVRGALDIVASQRDEADLTLIRHLLSQGLAGLSLTVINYLRTLGDAGDVKQLGKSQRFSLWNPAERHFENFDRAVRAILKLENRDFAELVVSELSDEVRARLIDLVPATEFAKMNDQTIIDLLLSDKLLVRRAAARKVPISVSRARIRKLLEAYRNSDEGRYYIVTHWLDLGIALSRAQARHVVYAKN